MKHCLLLSCATCALAAWANVGHAATASATATNTAQSSPSVTEIVVTAEKREQSLQRVPVAVSVFTGAQRDTIGISTVADVTNFAPGFTYDPATVHAYLRGVGRQSVNVTDDQRVSNYEDEFYVYSPYGLAKSSLFLSQEQIERGPQNVGGRNAAAGSIDMISVRPTEQPYAEMRASVGNFGSYHVEGAASGPIAPGLTARVAGFWDAQDQGFYKNLIGVSEGHVVHEWYGEGQIDWKPNDKFEFWARAFAEGWNNRGDAGSRVGPDIGSWDETNLTDGAAYVAGGLFINPTFGYAAPPAFGGNAAANAALTTAQLAGISFDPTPLSVSLVNPNIRNNPSTSSPTSVFLSQIPRTVKLSGYDDFNFIATYHAPTFDIKYNAGVQGYNYYLDDPGDGPEESANNVKSFVLPGNKLLGTLLNTSFGGGAFPGCLKCGVNPANPLGPPIDLPAATPLTIGDVTVFPQIHANYVEDDWWTAHDLTFQSTTDSPLQWTVGGFGYYQHYNQPYRVYDNNQPQLANPVYALGSALISATNPVCAAFGGLCGFGPAIPAPPNPSNTIGYFDYKFNVMSLGGYGQASYKINDQWKVTGDLRYSWDHKWGVENSRYLFWGSALLDAALPAFGPGTQALDITPSQTCLTGTPDTVALPDACNSGPLAPGVKSKGVILANGYAQRQLDITSSAVTGGGEVSWTPTPDIFTYFRYGRGYESPSFNAGQVIALPATKPEFLNAYEIGYKQTFGRQLLVDIAAFYYDYDGLQVPLSIANGGVIENLFVNVPKSLSEGVEVEAYWTPIPPLTLSLSYSYDRTEVLTGCSGTIVKGVFNENPGALCIQDTNDPAAVAPGAKPVPGGGGLQSVKGDPLPNAPLHKLALDGAYTFHFVPGDLTFSATFAFRDSTTSSLFGRFYDTAPSWYDIDLRALWKGPNDRYEVIAYVKNLTNTLQYAVGNGGAGLAGSANSVSFNGVGLNWVTSYNLNPPRTFGLEVRYKFF